MLPRTREQADRNDPGKSAPTRSTTILRRQNHRSLAVGSLSGEPRSCNREQRSAEAIARGVDGLAGTKRIDGRDRGLDGIGSLWGARNHAFFFVDWPIGQANRAIPKPSHSGRRSQAKQIEAYLSRTIMARHRAWTARPGATRNLLRRNRPPGRDERTGDKGGHPPPEHLRHSRRPRLPLDGRFRL